LKKKEKKKGKEPSPSPFSPQRPTGPTPSPANSPAPRLFFFFPRSLTRRPTCRHHLLPPAPFPCFEPTRRRDPRRAWPCSLAFPSFFSVSIKAIIRPRSLPFNLLPFLPFPYPLYTRMTRRPSMARPPAATPPSASPSPSLALLKPCKSFCPPLSLSHSFPRARAPISPSAAAPVSAAAGGARRW
jgi:hypothetical protein